MLVANETVAEHFYWLQLPFVYRIHETPSAEKMEDLNKFIATFGYHIKGDLEDVHPKEIQSLVEKIKGTKEEESISTIALRSMKQAKYSPQCIGHFGLAAKYYCHFTSPIRRYPDLQIHRIIKEQLNNKLNNKRQEQLSHIVEYASTQSSERERAAELAERDVHDFYKACYMADKVGQEFDGVVSSVTSFGMFVELENTVEGLIRLANMYKTKDLLNPACIVDANHSNSGKMYAEQIRITKEVIHSRNHSNDVKQLVKGVMIESYIEPGCQKVGEGVYGKSITDPCLGWEESEKLLYTIADMLK